MIVNSRGGKATMFQGTKKAYINLGDLSEYSLSTSTTDEQGYFSLEENGREQAFQIVMPTAGKMKVLGIHEDPGEEGFLYFSAGENSFLVKRVYSVVDNVSDEFYITY